MALLENFNEKHHDNVTQYPYALLLFVFAGNLEHGLLE